MVIAGWIRGVLGAVGNGGEVVHDVGFGVDGVVRVQPDEDCGKLEEPVAGQINGAGLRIHRCYAAG